MKPVTVLFFATLKDKAGTTGINLDLPENCNVFELKQILFQRFPSLPQSSSSMLVAVNQQYAFDRDVIPAGAEIALFPPVSGGSDFPTSVAVTADPLDLDQLQRDEGHETQRLEYEAYVPMAEAKMRQVAEEIRRRWPKVEGIAIVQRIGKLLPGTPTVLIACSAAHRDTGVFEAARYGIDRLKEIVPIWKKEFSSQGEEWVEGGYIPNPNDW